MCCRRTRPDEMPVLLRSLATSDAPCSMATQVPVSGPASTTAPRGIASSIHCFCLSSPACCRPLPTPSLLRAWAMNALQVYGGPCDACSDATGSEASASADCTIHPPIGPHARARSSAAAIAGSASGIHSTNATISNRPRIHCAPSAFSASVHSGGTLITTSTVPSAASSSHGSRRGRTSAAADMPSASTHSRHHGMPFHPPVNPRPSVRAIQSSAPRS